MSALLERSLPPFEAGAMRVPDLTEIIAIERQAYPVPWTHGNFVDSLAAAYPAEVLRGTRAELLGYWVAMQGVDEMHLLNITVAPAVQGRGHARTLVDALVAVCRECRAGDLWLEVRAGNDRARALYAHLGFTQVGVRKGYYPAPFGRREDAVVMSLKFDLPRVDDAMG